MPISLTTHCEASICVAVLEGPLTLSPKLARMSRELAEALERFHATGIVVDLSAVDDMDSAGLGELVNIYKSAIDRKLRVVFTGMNHRIAEMMDMTRLDDLLRSYQSWADAEAASPK